MTTVKLGGAKVNLLNTQVFLLILWSRQIGDVNRSGKFNLKLIKNNLAFQTLKWIMSNDIQKAFIKLFFIESTLFIRCHVVHSSSAFSHK